MRPYLLGLYEKAMPENLSFHELLSAAGRAGFDFVEISIDETDARLARLDWSVSERARLLDSIFEAGVPIGSMCLSAHRRYPLGSHNPSVRARSMALFKQALSLAVDLGIRVIQLAGYDVYYEQSDEQTRAWFLENLLTCAELAARDAILLGFETMETPFMDTVEKAMRYVREVNSPYLGVYPDLGNLSNAAALYGKHVTDDLCAGRGHLLAVHIKETAPGRYRDMEYGEGCVDFHAGIATALDLGVLRFVAEFWHNRTADWPARLVAANHFVRKAIETARFAGASGE